MHDKASKWSFDVWRKKLRILDTFYTSKNLSYLSRKSMNHRESTTYRCTNGNFVKNKLYFEFLYTSFKNFKIDHPERVWKLFCRKIMLRYSHLSGSFSHSQLLFALTRVFVKSLYQASRNTKLNSNSNWKSETEILESIFTSIDNLGDSHKLISFFFGNSSNGQWILCWMFSFM